MLLCQLPAHRNPPISQGITKLPKGLQKPMGRFIDNHRPRLAFQLLQHVLAFLLIRRQKGLKSKSPRPQSRQRQRRHTGAGSRQHRHRNARLRAHFHQLLARIRDTRHSGIRDQRDIFARPKLLHQLPALIELVVLMIAGHGRMNFKMIQKLDAVAGILRRNHIHLF